MEKKKDARLERNFLTFREFEEQIKRLKNFRILSLGELCRVLEKKEKIKNAAVITFDDGCANNVAASEILKKHKFPWSLFVSTETLGPGGTVWTYELSLLILHGRAKKFNFLERTWPLFSREERETAFQAVRGHLKKITAGQKNSGMALIRSQFPEKETARLLEEFPSFKMLSWDQIRGLSRSGVEIGSHGGHHEIHHERQPVEVRIKELTDSKLKIEKELLKPCRFFAFPNGNSVSSSPQELKNAGYELGFTTQPGNITKNFNRFLLPRIEPAEFFKAKKSLFNRCFPI